MGSCISKCIPLPSPPPLPQDKLVISQSPSSTTNPLYHLSVAKPPLSSSSSSSSSALSSLSSSKTSSYSYSSASSLSKDASFSNKFLLSRPRKKPQVIVRHQQDHPAKLHPPRMQSPSRPVNAPLKPSAARTNQTLPAKRARSGSPTTSARQKSSKGRVCTRGSVPPPYRVMPSPRKPNRVCSNDITPPKEKVRPPSPCKPEITQLSSREREVSLHWVNSKEGLNRSREVAFDQQFIEDIDNPLIAMDCFIFL